MVDHPINTRLQDIAHCEIKISIYSIHAQLLADTISSRRPFGMFINNRMSARGKPSFLEEPISRVGPIKLHHVRPAHLSPKSLPHCELLICTFLRRTPGHLLSNECTNLINNEQLPPVIDSKQAPFQCGNSLANNRKMRNLLHFLEHASTWHPPCSFPGTSQENKGVIDEDANRYHVQENSRAQDPTTGFHL